MKTLNITIIVLLSITLLSSSVVYAEDMMDDKPIQNGTSPVNDGMMTEDNETMEEWPIVVQLRAIIAELEATITGLETKITELKEDKQNKNAKITELRDKLKAKNNQDENQDVKLQAKLDKKDAKIDRLENKIVKLEEIIDRKDSKIDRKDTNIDNKKEKLKIKQDKIDEMVGEMDEILNPPPKIWIKHNQDLSWRAYENSQYFQIELTNTINYTSLETQIIVNSTHAGEKFRQNYILNPEERRVVQIHVDTWDDGMYSIYAGNVAGEWWHNNMNYTIKVTDGLIKYFDGFVHGGGNINGAYIELKPESVSIDDLYPETPEPVPHNHTMSTKLNPHGTSTLTLSGDVTHNGVIEVLAYTSELVDFPFSNMTESFIWSGIKWLNMTERFLVYPENGKFEEVIKVNITNGRLHLESYQKDTGLFGGLSMAIVNGTTQDNDPGIWDPHGSNRQLLSPFVHLIPQDGCEWFSKYQMCM